MQVSYDGGGTAGPANSQTTLPAPSVASPAAAGWSQANEALTFSITENLALYKEARKNGDWSQCVSFLEGAAVASLRLGDVVLARATIAETNPNTPISIPLADLLDCLQDLTKACGFQHEQKSITPAEISLVIDDPTPDLADPTPRVPMDPTIEWCRENPNWRVYHPNWKAE